MSKRELSEIPGGSKQLRWFCKSDILKHLCALEGLAKLTGILTAISHRGKSLILSTLRRRHGQNIQGTTDNICSTDGSSLEGM